MTLYLLLLFSPAFCYGKMASALKKTTNLTGLAVATNPHHSLGVLYSKILRTLQKMPDESAYKKSTEEVIKQRATIVKQTPNIADIEKKINCGQVEELIIQAENELTLARKIIAWKVWEPLIADEPKGQWNWPPVK